MIDSSSGGNPLGGSGVRALRRQPKTPDQIDQQFKDVSKLYEKQFLREMVKSMRSTVHESGFIKQNQAEKIFREQLDQEHVEKWGDRGGIGMADMIYKQLIERYGEAAGLKERVGQVRGPISVEHQEQFQVRNQVSQSKYPLTYEFEKKSVQDSTLMSLSAPWAGKISRQIKLSPDETLLEMIHENGLNSRFVFRGQASTKGPGDSFGEGQKLGLLSPDAKTFFWSLQMEQNNSPQGLGPKSGPEESKSIAE